MVDPMDVLRRVDVFHTEISAARAVVYARLEGLLPGDGFTLGGSVCGPISNVTQVLSATLRLRDLGPGATLLARAVIPDPCYWSVETPALYRVQIELQQAGQSVASESRWLALRGLGVSGADLTREGKRWVLRGITNTTTEPDAGPGWRASGASIFTYVPPAADLLSTAAEQGVLVLTRIEGPFAALLDKLRELARQPAVGIVLLPANSTVYPGFDLRQVAPNLRLGYLLPPDARWEPVPWADLVVAVVEDPAQLPRRLVGCKQPVICLRPTDEPLSLDAARAACDALQRDLAHFGQFAGYLV